MTGGAPPALERLLAPPDPAAGPVDVVIDSDVTNEVDDQFALVWALLRPDRLRLVGLHACPWEASPELYLRPDVDALRDGHARDEVSAAVLGPEIGVAMAYDELQRVTALLGREDVPVRRGSATWLPDAGTPVRSEAAEALVELAHADREGPLYVAAIGAATNVASALLLDPTIRERVVVVWTSAYPTWYPRPNRSYNMTLDLAASRVLVDSGVPLVYAPGYYVGEELRVGRPELEQCVRGRGVAGDYLWDAYDAHWLTSSRAPGATKVIWDLICLAWLIDPAWVATDLQPSPVLDEELRWQHPPGRHLIREAYDVARDAVFADLYRVLADRG